jgi:hypothetical protein
LSRLIDQRPEPPRLVESDAFSLLAIAQLANDSKAGIPFEEMAEVDDSPGVRTVDMIVPTTSQDLIAGISPQVEDGPLPREDVSAHVALRVDHPPTLPSPPHGSPRRRRERTPALTEPGGGDQLTEDRQPGRSALPAIMIAMPTAEIYTLLLAGLLVGGVLWVVTRFMDRD